MNWNPSTLGKGCHVHCIRAVILRERSNAYKSHFIIYLFLISLLRVLRQISVLEQRHYQKLNITKMHVRSHTVVVNNTLFDMKC